MSNMFKRQMWIFLIFLASGLLSEGHAQDFLKGFKLFNRGEYDSLISYVPKFVEQNPQQAGLARYFLAESYYNKALNEREPERAINLLERAWKAFRQAYRSSDLETHFKEFHSAAAYKMGWCSYRLAELKTEPLMMLQRAHSEFIRIRSDAPDSLRLFAYFMAADSKLKENLLRFYQMADDRFGPKEFNEVLSSFSAVGEALDKVKEFLPSDSTPHNLLELQAISALRRESLNYYLGKYYAVLSSGDLEKVNFSGNKSTLETTALTYFKKANYDSLFSNNSVFQRTFQPQIAYLNLVNYLNQYVMTKSELVKRKFLAEWSKLKHASFAAERWFRCGNLYQGHPATDGADSLQVAIRYYASSDGIAESSYWLAYLQMIQGEKARSKQNFSRFIEATEGMEKVSFRERMLLSDARYRKSLLDFESFYLRDQIKRLHELSLYLSGFSAESKILQKRKEQLDLLVKCSLIRDPSRLWNQALSGTEQERLAQAFETIKFVLPRAVLNIGVTRQKYVDLLKRLLALTNNKDIDETRFFEGIVKTLEAELQARPDEKSREFREAAKLLKPIRSGYEHKVEADYVRGVCLFFADELDQAEVIFRSLINDEHYLRALFYFAEICRARGQGLAAKKCYKVIMEKFQDVSTGHSEFWLLNAQAGLASCEDDGDLLVLKDLNMESVAYQPAIETERLYFETLADQELLTQMSLRESANWFMKYGLPQKEFYVSKLRIEGSLFADENIFEDYPGLINERRGPVTSTLKLTIGLPKSVDDGLDVRLNNTKLTSSDDPGVYFLRRIPLDSEYELTISNEDCFQYKEKMRFTRPGQNIKVVILNKRLQYLLTQKVRDILRDFDYPFAPRWDGNFVLNSLPEQRQDSRLVKDFASHYELRDCALDKVGNRILVVNYKHNAVWIYSNDAVSKKIGALSMNLSDSLNSPEGIAINAGGHIFIADWGNHRIVELTGDGELVRKFGTFGTNGPSDIGTPVKLSFPTRVAVVEDRQGFEINGRQFFRETYLFVADQNGIHICGNNGDYLGTMIAPSDKFSSGSFYGFQLSGYGEQSKLFIVNRLGENKGKVFEYVAN